MYLLQSLMGFKPHYAHSVGLGSLCNLVQLGEFQGGIQLFFVICFVHMLL